MNEPLCVQMAAEMFGVNVKDLPESLRRMLLRADELAGEMEGQIVSRQAVAAIIVSYENSLDVL